MEEKEEDGGGRRRSDNSSSSLLPHLCKLLVDLHVRLGELCLLRSLLLLLALLLRGNVDEEEMGREARGIKEGRVAPVRMSVSWVSRFPEGGLGEGLKEEQKVDERWSPG